MKNMIKNTVVSLAAVAALSSAANADVMSVFMPDNSVSGVYAGLGFGANTMEITDGKGIHTGYETESYAPLIQVGWQYNKYFAFESRYQWGETKATAIAGSLPGDSVGNTKFSSWAFNLKPQYSYKWFKAYGTLGYGYVSTDVDVVTVIGTNISGSRTESSSAWGFQYGIGAEFTFAKNTSFFIDYTVLYDDNRLGDAIINSTTAADDNVKIYTTNFGINYKF